MNTRTFYNCIFWAGLAIWILENVYFGWNATAQSGLERLTDFVSNVAMYVGVVGSIAIDVVDRRIKELLEK